MAFGRLQRKWRLLSESLAYGLKKMKILHECARLHNYVISEETVTDANWNDNLEADPITG